MDIATAITSITGLMGTLGLTGLLGLGVIVGGALYLFARGSKAGR